MSNITIDVEKCDKCGECVDMCPVEIFALKDDAIVTDHEDECTLCEVCVDVCPNGAIKVE
ncbi:MAG: 4Fe-4S binding protein [archaeon]|nr:4Fe-4S binding protein [archaeon]